MTEEKLLHMMAGVGKFCHLTLFSKFAIGVWTQITQLSLVS